MYIFSLKNEIRLIFKNPFKEGLTGVGLKREKIYGSELNNSYNCHFGAGRGFDNGVLCPANHR
jgi:hypothetical protein